MIPVKPLQEWKEEGMKENGGKNLCKCHNVSSPVIKIKENKIRKKGNGRKKFKTLKQK
jgi:hypothetical protein